MLYPRLDAVAPDRATGTSTIRALRVVEAVAAAGDGVTAKVIARRLGIPLPSVYRAIGTLVAEGYLVRLHDVRGYGLGYRVAQLHRSLTEQVRPPAVVRQVLHEVHTAVGAASYLAVLRDLDVVVAYVDDCAEHPRPAPMRVGEPMAVYTTAAGKAVLAELRPGSLAELAARSGVPGPPCTELARIRADGTAVEAHEYQPEVAGIAAPVHAPDGAVSGALGLTVPRVELVARRRELEQAVRAAAARAEACVGQARTAARESRVRRTSSWPASGSS
jgi:IclR family transcriptional regulator, acetate operon repressor